MSDAPAQTSDLTVLEAEIAKIKAKLFGDQTPAPDVHEVRLNNLAALKAERAAYMASWESEDAAYKTAKEAQRQAVMESFDRGLAAFVATTGIEAKWDDVPAEEPHAI